jgi:hypothetical protein
MNAVEIFIGFARVNAGRIMKVRRHQTENATPIAAAMGAKPTMIYVKFLSAQEFGRGSNASAIVRIAATEK